MWRAATSIWRRGRWFSPATVSAQELPIQWKWCNRKSPSPETYNDSPVDSSTERERTPPVRRSPKHRRNIIILAVILVVFIGGLFLWRYLSSYESTDDAQADVHLYPVSARVSGYVIRVNVGDK